MSEKAEVVVECDFCNAENRIVAFGVIGSDPVRCSHCGQLLGSVSDLSALERQQPQNDSGGPSCD